MQEARQVPTADGQAYAATLNAVFAEVSAKDSTGPLPSPSPSLALPRALH